MKKYNIRQILEMRISGLLARKTILALINNGKIKAIEMGTGRYKKYYISEEELKKFM